MSSISSENIRTAVDLVTHADLRVTAHEIAEQAWGERCYLGLRCDLSALPERKPARLALEMRAAELLSFHGFEMEREHAASADLKQLLLRERFRLHGVTTLYVAETSRGRPIYCQWLIRPSEMPLMDACVPDTYEPLGDGEVMLEGAYTFTEFRGKKAMSDGMWQLLAIARDEGFASALTYVADDNVASLRGCAAVGFVPDHAHVSVRRLTRRRTDRLAVDDAMWAAWRAATGR
jgi:hypothetical protein